MNFNIGWHILYVKSRSEKRVYQSLIDISLESFLPEYKSIRQWSDRKKTIVKPLFPSYVFVNINSSMDFHKALSVQGACTYISFGKDYARISDTEIERIKLFTQADGLTEVETNVQLPKIGEIRTIKDGALKGLECEVLRVDNTHKIIVRIDSLRQNIMATIPAEVILEPQY
jgi:transcription antitermination factor NusG